MKATLIDGSIILRESVNYPKKNITIIKDLDEGLEWLLDYKEDRPSYDNNTQKLEVHKNITTIQHPDHSDFNQYLISFEVIDLSAEELEINEESKAKEKQVEHIANGVQLFSKTYRKIWRKKNEKKVINKVKARKLMRWFQPTYISLNLGNWSEAENEILDTDLILKITDENDNQMTNIYEFLRDEIANYLIDYDL